MDSDWQRGEDVGWLDNSTGDYKAAYSEKTSENFSQL